MNITKLNEWLSKEITFLVCIVLICAGIMGGTSTFLTYGVGLFNGASMAAMLTEAVTTGGYVTIVAYAGSFLFARLTEGPLVGILDIGGSLMTGVGGGLAGLILSLGYDVVMYNFALSLLAGAVIGLAIGIAILLIRKASTSSMGSGGTEIMIGVGNNIGAWFTPIVLIYACTYSLYTAVGAIVVGVIFHLRKMPVLGGAIIGSMIFGYAAYLLGWLVI